MSMQGFVFLVFLALIIFWIYQLVDVIAMDDKDFKGRNDKLIFFMVVFFGLIFGAIGFAVWKLFQKKNIKTDTHLEAAFKSFMKEHEQELKKD